MEQQSNNNGNQIVNVQFNYPEGYEGKRFHADKSVHPMSLQSAQVLVSRGIATILDDYNVEEKEAEQPLAISTSGPIQAFIPDGVIDKIVTEGQAALDANPDMTPNELGNIIENVIDDAFKGNSPVADLGNVENVETTPVVTTENTKKAQSKPAGKKANGKKANGKKK